MKTRQDLKLLQIHLLKKMTNNITAISKGYADSSSEISIDASIIYSFESIS